MTPPRRPADRPAADRSTPASTVEFLRALWALDHALHRVSKRMASSLGVTGPQRLVLRTLDRRPDSTAGSLAKALHLHPSTMTGLLARLERQRLIQRTTDPADRRATRLTLTESGRRLAGVRAGTVEAAVARALATASPAQLSAALDLLAGVSAALGAICDPRQPTRSSRS